MENTTIPDKASVAPLGCFGGRAPRRRDAPQPARTHGSEGGPSTRRAAKDCAGQPVRPPNPFESVVCADERTATDDAARHQATLLASPGGTVTLAPTFQLTWQGQRAFNHTCDGYDLLALGAGDTACTALEYVAIPTLIARLCPLGMQVTDTIVVCVDNSRESRRAVELAGLLAACHRRTVTILAAPPAIPALDRAIAASFQVVLRATGAIPRVYGESLPPERTIPAAAAALTASLMVLGTGQSPRERRTTALIAGAVGCSVLVVPAAQLSDDRKREHRVADA